MLLGLVRYFMLLCCFSFSVSHLCSFAFAMGVFGEAGIESRLFLISWNVAGFRRTDDLSHS